MTYKRFYFMSLASVFLASIYPIYMGVVVLTAYFQNGGVNAADYPKYIIPYTPICISLITCTAFLPLIFSFCKKFTLLLSSVLGVVLFFTTEIAFERVVVFEGLSSANIESWQLYSCIATPQTMETIGNPLSAQYSSAFKVHFYIIALMVILAAIGVVYGFSKMIREKVYDKKVPLFTQLICVVLFIALCILACFTAFFRSGNIQVSTLSAFLMSAFFVVFGIMAGVYAGTLFYGKKRLFSTIIPAIVALLTTIVMYIGELVLMGGDLFKFGSGFIFEPLGIIPFALIDIFIIFLSGVFTYTILKLIRPKATV